MFIALILKYYPSNTLLYAVFYFAQGNDKNWLFAAPSLSCVPRAELCLFPEPLIPKSDVAAWLSNCITGFFSNYNLKLTCYTDCPIYFEVALQQDPL